MITIYVINLPGSVERRASMVLQFAQHGITNYEFVDGIDVRSLAGVDHLYHRESFIQAHGRPAVPGEIGCCLAHGAAWKRISESGCPGVILEDDVFINDNFKKFIEDFPKLDFDIIFLNRPDYCELTGTQDQLIPLKKHHFIKSCWGTISYAISNRYAAQLHADHVPVQHAADAWELRHTRKYFATADVCCWHNDLVISTIENRDISGVNFGRLAT